ncbi:hypothetical protein RB593_003386 [Gaeumannomyces tritici]
MHSSGLPLLACVLVSGAGLVSGVPFTRRSVQCYFELPADSGTTCTSMASSWGISADGFAKINPGTTCSSLEAGKTYCVIGEWTPDTTAPPATTPSTTKMSTAAPSTTTTSTTTQPTTKTTSPATASNSPQMPGVATNCNRFYKIQSNDHCDSVAQKNGISTAQLRSWNTASCSNLWLNYYICTGAPGAAAPQPTTAPSAPDSSNSPQQPGAVSNCGKWSKVVSGDTCDVIAARNTVTVAQLRSWNTQINPNCSNLMLDYFACVGVPGAATPMPGIVSNCRRYSQVVSGDNCDALARNNGISVSDFKRWNTFLNSECTNLWADALVCTSAYVSNSNSGGELKAATGFMEGLFYPPVLSRYVSLALSDAKKCLLGVVL